MKATRSSGLQTGDAIISSRPAILSGAEIITDGVNDATLVVYNNTSAAGQVLFKGKVTGPSNFGGATYEIPVNAELGIFADITGTGAAYIILFDYA